MIRSDGNMIRDYFYVEDGAAAYMLLAEQLAAPQALRGEAFNFSNELQVSVLQLVESLGQGDGNEASALKSGTRPEMKFGINISAPKKRDGC